MIYYRKDLEVGMEFFTQEGKAIVNYINECGKCCSIETYEYIDEEDVYKYTDHELMAFRDIADQAREYGDHIIFYKGRFLKEWGIR